MSEFISARGFTLIELLVVIAIIGILSSVVLASLSGARKRGGDSAIKQNLSNMRAQAEMFYDITNQTYGNTFPIGACSTAVAGSIFATSTVAGMLVSAGKASGGNGMNVGTCQATAGTWSASVPLYSDPTKSWCVDNQGNSKQINGPITGGSPYCP